MTTYQALPINEKINLKSHFPLDNERMDSLAHGLIDRNTKANQNHLNSPKR